MPALPGVIHKPLRFFEIHKVVPEESAPNAYSLSVIVFKYDSKMDTITFRQSNDADMLYRPDIDCSFIDWLGPGLPLAKARDA